MHTLATKAVEQESLYAFAQAQALWQAAFRELDGYAAKFPKATHFNAGRARARIDINLQWYKRRAARCEYLYNRRAQDADEFKAFPLDIHAWYSRNCPWGDLVKKAARLEGL